MYASNTKVKLKGSSIETRLYLTNFHFVPSKKPIEIRRETPSTLFQCELCKARDISTIPPNLRQILVLAAKTHSHTQIRKYRTVVCVCAILCTSVCIVCVCAILCKGVCVCDIMYGFVLYMCVCMCANQNCTRNLLNSSGVRKHCV